jgi:Tfp pilus assembly protein FimT
MLNTELEAVTSMGFHSFDNKAGNFLGALGKCQEPLTSETSHLPSVMLRQRRHRTVSGFTLVELMVVVGVLVLLGILASSVLMDSSGWLAHYRLRSAAKGIAMVLQSAKIEAIKSNTLCTVTFDQTIDDGTHYDCMAFVDVDEDMEYDSDGNGSYNPSGDETIVKRFDLSFYTGVQFDPDQGGGAGITFTDNDDGKASISFNSRGLPRSNGGGFGGGAIYLVNDHGSRLKIEVSNAGSIRIEKE